MNNKISILAKELLAKLNKSSEKNRFENAFPKNVVEIAAVTGASGVAASKIGEETMWTASIDLIAWKNLKNDSVVKEHVRLQWLVDDNNLEESSERLAENSIVKLQVRKAEESMMLLRVLDTDYKDRDLDNILQDSLKPVYFNDNQLGQFELDKSIKVFEKKTTWAGEECSLYFDWDVNEEVIASALGTAHVLFRDQEEWNEKIRKFAADKLLDTANDWLQDNDEAELKEITKEMFIDFMSVDSISVYPGGEFEIFFFDGDMFWGHSIIVSGKNNGELTSAEIAG
ncbi:DUF2262 domain-containing protein [Mesobacillus subterraneus]|uniref:DUF2262 domain-containing protein n=1 Tax=Mesobacillus subterraneus TaxID=285983 RepID=A0A427TVU0_9BACI|nr:DUF2262 domain-containing protein [Mesobacillus subterraneus]RSD28456.1 DUF2262 domain-containing protein [Mesobacillus subterraneus]